MPTEGCVSDRCSLLTYYELYNLLIRLVSLTQIWLRLLGWLLKARSETASVWVTKCNSCCAQGTFWAFPQFQDSQWSIGHSSGLAPSFVAPGCIFSRPVPSPKGQNSCTEWRAGHPHIAEPWWTPCGHPLKAPRNSTGRETKRRLRPWPSKWREQWSRSKEMSWAR